MFAWNGIQNTFKGEASFKIHCIATLLVLILLGLMKASPVWWAIILLTVGGVLSLELINTSLEHLVDHLHPEKHPSIKLVKDCAAGAVLILSIIAVGVFAAFLWGHLEHV